MNKKDIENWLNQYNIKNYIINKDLIVDVFGDVNLYSFRNEIEKNRSSI